MSDNKNENVVVAIFPNLVAADAGDRGTQVVGPGQ